MKNTLFEKFRAWAVGEVAGLMNLNSDMIIGQGCATNERWVMELGWWIEGQLHGLFSVAYNGSDLELEQALDGWPLHHMTERQRTYYIGVMAEGGLS